MQKIMGGGVKELTLIDSIRNGETQTAMKILQNSMINKNQSLKSKFNQKFKPIQNDLNGSSSNTNNNNGNTSSKNFISKKYLDFIFTFSLSEFLL